MILGSNSRSVTGNGYFTLAVIAGNGLFAVTISTVAGIVAENRVFLITQMLVHLSFKHLLDSSCKQTLELSLNIACAFALRHDELHELHFLLA